MNCAIKWSWNGEQPLAVCDNPAVVEVQRVAYHGGTNHWGRSVDYDATEWFSLLPSARGYAVTARHGVLAISPSVGQQAVNADCIDVRRLMALRAGGAGLKMVAYLLRPAAPWPPGSVRRAHAREMRRLGYVYSRRERGWEKTHAE